MNEMTANNRMARSSAGMPLPWVAALLLLVPVFIFWRPYFFFINDDWTGLIQMADQPFWQYLVGSDGEHWFPFFHLIFYGLVKITGEHYAFLVLVNSLSTGINAFLLYLFWGRHFGAGLALALGLLYDGAAAHHATIWNSYYLGCSLSLGFFLGALLLTDDYLHTPSGGRLLGIGVCSLLAILTHGYIILALASLPLYVGLMAEEKRLRQAWPLTLMIGGIYLVFAAGYLHFARITAAASQNQQIFSSLPGPGYLLHGICGAFLSPFFYLFWGHFHFPIWAYVGGTCLLVLSIAVVRRAGDLRAKRLVIWGLLFNALPFLLVSLTRYQKSIAQAFESRYVIFTSLGTLLLVGMAWHLLSVRYRQKRWFQIASLVLLASIVFGQIFSLPIWKEEYLAMSQAAKTCYQLLDPKDPRKILSSEDSKELFCPQSHPFLTEKQALVIKRFLHGLPAKP